MIVFRVADDGRGLSEQSLPRLMTASGRPSSMMRTTATAWSYIAPYNVALIYAGLGNNDKACEWLNRAYNARSYLLVEYLNTDPRLNSLYADPRFNALGIHVGLPSRKTD